VTHGLAAQELPVTNPDRVGLSAERLAHIGTVFQEHVDEGRIAGAMGMVIRNSQVAYQEEWGYRDLEARDPLEAGDLFRIYSMTKPITAVAVMMLWEEGKFALGDPIGRYIPELARLQVAKLEEGATIANLETERPRRQVTIEDLLRHTSGLTYGIFSNTPVDSMYLSANLLGAKDLDEMMRGLGDIPLIAQPGARWIYSVSTDVLGRLVEVVSGMPFDAFLRTRIFERLDMEDTGFYAPAEDHARLTRTYRHTDAQGTLALGDTVTFVSPVTMFSGGGGLVSTARDYARFTQMVLNGGALNGTRILGRKTVDFMRVDHLGDVEDPGTSNGFGLGFAVKESVNALLTSVGTFYWGGLHGTAFWIDPEEDLIGIFMIQIYPNRSTNFGQQFQQLVYSALVG
jgi:CubicO group peptidase (beta-lactamase class C family)